jgi:hypothetical protein
LKASSSFELLKLIERSNPAEEQMQEQAPDYDVCQNDNVSKLYEKVEAIALMDGIDVSSVITKAIVNYVCFWDVHRSTETKLSVVDRKTNKIKYDIGKI